MVLPIVRPDRPGSLKWLKGSAGMKVCMFSLSECDQYYITARRVAKSLADAGHDVTIIAFMGVSGVQPEPQEYCDGYRIVRVNLKIADILKIGIVRSIAGRALERYIYSQSTQQSKSKTEPDRISKSDRVEEIMPVRASGLRDWWKGRIYKCISGLWRGAMRIEPKWVSDLWRRLGLYFLYIDYYCHAYSVAKREHAQVYHAHDLVTLPVAWLCSRTGKAKLVYDMHELWIDRGERKRFFLDRFLLMRLESFLIRRTDANIMAGYSSAKELVKRYKIPEPVVVLNAPVYLEYKPSTLFRDDLKIPAGQKILLYAGVINSSRGIEEMIKSLVFLPDCCLVLFGLIYNPSYVLGLKNTIARDGLKDRVYFHDPVPFNEVSKYAMSADIGFALHKNIGLNYYYVSPLKLFEYMGAGLPVVASNFPDLKRFVEGYNFGVTCNPDSPEEIAHAVRQVLADNSKYEIMRQNALKAAKVFNWENESKKLIAIYDDLAKN